MKIACIGWGSLIWRPESLSIHRQWFNDGPLLPVEFARQSQDGRLTLVITDTAKPLRTLWALMATTDLKDAKESLRIREGIGTDNAKKYITDVSAGEVTKDAVKITIQQWLTIQNIDAAIWTSLPPKFNLQDGVAPTEIEAVDYLSSLDVNKRKFAEEYIRKAPPQIDSLYRRAFEKRFGWTFLQH